MKKIILFVCCLLIVSFFSAQELESDFYDEEWESLFESAEDISAEENDISEINKQTNVITQIIGNPNINVWGHFDGDLAIGIDVNEIQQHINNAISGFFIPLNGGINFENTLDILISPSDIFQLRGTIYTSIGNNLSMGLTSVFCNYIPFDGFYLAIGRKSIGWNYTRIFSDSSYNNSVVNYTLTNYMADSGSYFVVESKYPWKKGTVSAVALCDTSKFAAIPGLRQIGYAFSSEISVPHVTTNLFCRLYGVDELKSSKFGGEGKVSFGGYDAYIQGQISSKRKEMLYNAVSKYDYGLITLGAYKLWDSQDPNYGLNIEYQYQISPTNNSYEHNNRVALQGGVKRMGRNKNFKLAMEWYHNFNKGNGEAGLSYIIANIFNYAQLTNGVKIVYEKNSTPVLTIGTAMQVDIDY